MNLTSPFVSVVLEVPDTEHIAEEEAAASQTSTAKNNLLFALTLSSFIRTLSFSSFPVRALISGGKSLAVWFCQLYRKQL